MTRATWDQTWMNVAEKMADRSLCDGRQIGAVIASYDNSYIVVGYNGPPAGFQVPTRVLKDGYDDVISREKVTCTDWCPRRQTGEQTPGYDNCVTIHAEANALIKADRSRITGGTLYVTSSPCWDCGKLVANSGVRRIVMKSSDLLDAHRNPGKTRNFMRDSGIIVEVW